MCDKDCYIKSVFHLVQLMEEKLRAKEEQKRKMEELQVMKQHC